jgi:hypothetical protein
MQNCERDICTIIICLVLVLYDNEDLLVEKREHMRVHTSNETIC